MERGILHKKLSEHITRAIFDVSFVSTKMIMIAQKPRGRTMLYSRQKMVHPGDSRLVMCDTTDGYFIVTLAELEAEAAMAR